MPVWLRWMYGAMVVNFATVISSVAVTLHTNLHSAWWLFPAIGGMTAGGFMLIMMVRAIPCEHSNDHAQ